MLRIETGIVTVAMLVAGVHAFAGNLSVVSVSPPNGTVNASPTAPIIINFDQAIQPSSVTNASIRAFGRWSGPVEVRFEFADNDQTVILNPDMAFSAGESVMVVVSHDLLSADGSPLRNAGYSFRFWTRTLPACLNFEEIDTMSNRTTPSEQTRIYGAAASDLDNDGWLDIITINEVSADLRVFMNKDDGSGEFHPFLQPPAPGLFEMSPNETADFNNDGFADVCAASTATSKILIFLGNGDGTFQPAQIITVGQHPLGIAVLDVDGDGDTDIVNGNYTSGNLSRLLNNGVGVFGAPTFFDAGVSGEYGVAAADMNNDGIMDLAVGGNGSQSIAVLKGNGNGTFSLLSTQDCGGQVWQVGIGDVNGDGLEDVHTSNSFSATGSILLNLGNGQLARGETYPTDGHSPATDLGDFDGDGDLDWLLSSFGGGLWRLLTNDGAGIFSVTQDFKAPSNPSCGTAMDLDNDGRLDVVLLDEIADVVILMHNANQAGDANCSSDVDVVDLLAVINAWGPCAALCAADLNGDGTVDVNDLLLVINNWS